MTSHPRDMTNTTLAQWSRSTSAAIQRVDFVYPQLMSWKWHFTCGILLLKLLPQSNHEKYIRQIPIEEHYKIHGGCSPKPQSQQARSVGDIGRAEAMGTRQMNVVQFPGWNPGVEKNIRWTCRNKNKVWILVNNNLSISSLIITYVPIGNLLFYLLNFSVNLKQ